MDVVLWRSLRTEWLKYRRTSLFWLTLLGSVLMPFMKVITCLVNPALFHMMMARDPWHFFLMINWHDTAAVMLPVYVILVCYNIAQTEYRNNAWKQLFTLPRTYADIFFSKFILLQVMTLIFLFFFNVFYLASGVVMFSIKHVPGITRFAVPWKTMLVLFVRIYVGTLTISVIQYWMSLRFRNFMVSVGAGLGLLFVFLFLGSWFEGHLYAPYLFPLFMFFVGHSDEQFSLPLLYLLCISTFLIALLLAFADIYNRKERG